MRPLATSSMKPTAAEATTTAKATFTQHPTVVQRSPWHSPVPYLFGGLAAMLGLIAFALIILACSHWNSSAAGEDEVDGPQKGENSSEEKVRPVFEERYLVIMAGEVKPTFLATPSSNYKSSCCKNSNSSNGNDETACNEKAAIIEVRVMNNNQELRANEDDQENYGGGEPRATQERSHS